MSSGLRSSTENEQTDSNDIQPWEKAEALRLMWLQHIRLWHVDKVDSGSTSCICLANCIWDVWILFNVVADGGRLGTQMTPLHSGFCWSLQVQPLTSIILKGMDRHDCSCLLWAHCCLRSDQSWACVNKITSKLTLIPSWSLYSAVN